MSLFANGPSAVMIMVVGDPMMCVDDIARRTLYAALLKQCREVFSLVFPIDTDEVFGVDMTHFVERGRIDDVGHTRSYDVYFVVLGWDAWKLASFLSGDDALVLEQHDKPLVGRQFVDLVFVFDYVDFGDHSTSIKKSNSSFRRT